jgi:hypothetical protein
MSKVYCKQCKYFPFIESECNGNLFVVLCQKGVDNWYNESFEKIVASVRNKNNNCSKFEAKQ